MSNNHFQDKRDGNQQVEMIKIKIKTINKKIIAHTNTYKIGYEQTCRTSKNGCHIFCKIFMIIIIMDCISKDFEGGLQKK